MNIIAQMAEKFLSKLVEFFNHRICTSYKSIKGTILFYFC